MTTMVNLYHIVAAVLSLYPEWQVVSREHKAATLRHPFRLSALKLGKCGLLGDIGPLGAGSLTLPNPSWGETREYNESDSINISGKPDWYRTLKPGAAVLRRQTLKRSTDNLNATFATPGSASHGVFFKVVGANPLLSLAPAIDAEITVGLRKVGGGIEYNVSGEHDGFPSYTLSLNGKSVYSHDCVAKGETPSSLKPWMDYSINIDWSGL